jgi:hypothetical protein
MQINVTEPGVSDRFYEPIDTQVNFTYRTSNNSVRVCYCNGTSLIEVPSQIYDGIWSGNYVNSSKLVFLTSLARNETLSYYVYYSRGDVGAANYTADINASNHTDYYWLDNNHMSFKTNTSRGGVMGEIYSRESIDSDNNLAAYAPAQLSPQIDKLGGSCSVTANSNPSIAFLTGPLVSKYSASGPVGACSINYEITYKMYSHSNYVLLAQNISSAEVSTWNAFYDDYLILKNGLFSMASYRNSTGLYYETIENGNGNDLTGLTNVTWISLENNDTFYSIADVILSSQETQSLAPSVSLYDDAAYEYWTRKSESLSVGTGDWFYLTIARIVFNPGETVSLLNETYTMLANPSSAAFGQTETSDSQPPVYTQSGYDPSSPNDTQNITCYSYWQDNLEIDYVTFAVTSPGINTSTQTSYNLNETWANYTIYDSQAEAGEVTCNITAYDIAGTANSTLIVFTVADATPPYFTSVINQPDNDAGLDPGVQINVTANLTEYSNVSSVILQYFSPTWGNWTNETMALQNEAGHSFIYAGNFSAPDEGVWRYRVYACDNETHCNISNTVDLNVSWDWTWTQTPAVAEDVIVLLGENASAVNITMNNTGDMVLGFTATSNWEDKEKIFFNGTPEGSEGYSFIMDAGSSLLIPVNITGKIVERSDNLTITIASLNASAVPQSNTTTTIVISYAGGPFLYVTITSYNASLQVGENLYLTGKVQNKGNETATSTHLIYTLPEGFTLLEGELDKLIGTLAVGYSAVSSITSSTGSAAAGIYTIILDSNCGENKTGSDSREVRITEPSGNGTVIVESGSVSYAAGASVTPSITREEKERLLQTEQIYELLTGGEQAFALTVENPFDGPLENVQVNVSGFLAQYLRIEPSSVDVIDINSSSNFTIFIEAPKYFTRGDHSLNFTIAGVINKTKRDGNVTRYSLTRLIESRDVILSIHEVSRDDAKTYLEKINETMGEMNGSGFNTVVISGLLQKAYLDILKRDYEDVKLIYQSVLESRENANNAVLLLDEIGGKVSQAEYNGLDVKKTNRILYLSKAAMDRGDFATSYARAEDAKVTYALETVGKFNLFYFIKNNALNLLALSILSAFLLWACLIGIHLNIIKMNLGKLRNEETILLGLIKQLQEECFEEKKMSMEEYKNAILQYEKRLSTVVKEIIKLETMKAHQLKVFKGEEKRLLSERDQLFNLVRENQRLYLESKKLDSRVYENRMQSYSERLAEVEETLANLEAEREMKKA